MEEYAFPGAAAPHCEYDRYDNCTSPDLAEPVANEPYSTPPGPAGGVCAVSGGNWSPAAATGTLVDPAAVSSCADFCPVAALSLVSLLGSHFRLRAH